MRFGRNGKLAPRYINLYPVIRRIGKVTYELDLPENLKAIHPIFLVSQLKKYISNESYILKDESIQVDQKLSYEER